MSAQLQHIGCYYSGREDWCNGEFSATCKDVVLRHGGQVLGVRASTNEVVMQTVNEVVFKSFSEVQDQLLKVTTLPQFESLACQRFASSCEAAINDHINEPH
uniref:Uncharacterized protein n=1 Tax=Physcomitrium patens TaxID=3218 RepID=A9SW29_PHYPA|nr:hypothetical protein PHYPA_020403 [Physcomitrium patens]